VLRRRSRRKEIMLEEILIEETQTSLPEVVTIQAEEARKVRALLETLPTDWREVLLLKYVEELSLREIGVAMHRTEKAVNSLLQRARSAARTSGKADFETEELP
jgi:RNA polymerase sigma-70 factor, ECF subfamily